MVPVGMTQKTIEELATNAVRFSILKCRYLDPFINDNDKEPSWDGYVNIHSLPTKTKQTFVGKVPVQVKGHYCENFDEDSITFDAEVADLKNYAHDGGVLYFVVYISQYGAASRIYYAELTLEKLHAYLDTCKAEQKKKRIHLQPFGENEEDITNIFRNFESQYRPNEVHDEKISFGHFDTVPSDTELAFAKELVCQRLSSDSENGKLIDRFCCRANPVLAANLKYYAWTDDSTGDVAYYVIKTSENRLLMYFSLKCGALFDGLDGDPWELKAARLDRESTENGSISRVSKTYPAVELVHFCINDDGRSYWKSIQEKYGINQSMSVVLFWLFVVPAINSVRATVGCRYVYTYVADATTENRLVWFYQNRLRFEVPDKLGVNKPVYDFMCTFMCQEIQSLLEYRMDFFEQFNRTHGMT